MLGENIDDDDDEYDEDMPQPKMDYETMKAAMEYEKNNTLNMVRVKEGVADFKKNFSEELTNSSEIIKEMVTPAFWKRVQFRKKFPAKVAASER